MKKTNVLRFVQSTLIVLLSAGIIGSNSMVAYAQNANAEEAVVEEASATVEDVETSAATEENTEAVSELEAVEVEETLAATEAASGTWGNIAWSYANGILTLGLKEGKTSASMDEPDSAPSSLSSYSNESICEMVAADYPWYEYRESITKIVIGDGIKSISDVAFFNMTKMEEIDISSSVSSIGYYAFRNCTSLKKVTLPAKLTSSSFGKGTFYNCSSLAEVSGNVMLSEYAYYGCTSLKTITLPVAKIPAYAFYGCTSLTEIAIPEGVTYIYDYAFYGCTGLTKVTIPEGVKYICDYTFSNCTGLTNITIPSSVSFSLGQYSFEGCTGLKEVTIKTDKVGYYTFKDCTSLVKVNFPTDQKCTVSTGSFYNCISLSEITGKVGNYDYVQYTFGNCKSLTSCQNLIDGESTIWYYTFSGCTGLKEITFSDQTWIVYNAFENCSGLTKITFEGEVPRLGEKAFMNCGLKEVWMEDDDYFTYDDDVLKGNSDCKVYGKLEGNAKDLAEDNSCTFVPTDKLPQTTMSTLSSASNGIRVTWAEGEYALKYDVYRCTLEGGNYTLIKSGVTGTEYIDTNVTPGVKYYYKVVSVGELAKSELSEASTAGMYLAAPTFKKIVNVVSGVHVYWNAADGAKTYSVYRSTSKTGDYTIVKQGLTATHYIDTTAVSGKTYYYKVLAVNGSFSTSSYVEPFKPYTYVGTPDITSRINKAAGVELGWNKIEGATGYAIYRKPYVGGSWARITTISGNKTFTYTDGAVKGNNGTIYRYTVRALAGSDMKTLSGCRNTGRTMVRLSSRTLNSAVKASANSIKCNWSTSAAVSGYEVRFMIGSTVYKTFTVGNYKTGAKTFTGLPSGYNYKVQVRAYKKVDGVGSFYSAWSTAKYVQL